ncbi:MAG: lysine--tRNA ligase [Acidobacteriota bacterium]|nr:MAG: lysine--tRNA ligase [Acidobacteriota bacterium]
MADSSKPAEDRRRHLERLRALGVHPYPARYLATHTVSRAVEGYRELGADALEDKRVEVAVAGRIVALRRHGKAGFADLSDGRERLQIYVKKDVAGERGFEIFSNCDLGDFAGARGPLFRTRAGELTVRVEELTFLSKALRPLPEKWHGLADVELRYRRRYLDLIANPEVRKIFETRTRLVTAMRGFLDAKGFLEVETPVLQPLYGGALATPFKTHHHALDMPLYLRIADELYLKRLVVGGMEKVYEICTDFRNEGISNVHNPEFTMVETYEAYASFEEVMLLTEEMLAHCVERATGSLDVEFREKRISLARPWKRMRYDEALCEHIKGFSPGDLENEERLRAVAAEHQVNLATAETPWDIVSELFEHLVEPGLVQPTFVTHLPRALSPLAKAEEENSPWAGRFELFAGGIELANGYSEQNDPDEQRARFEEIQAANPECKVDEDYLLALSHGMPPTGGLGVGIDRLTMLATGAPNIREVILFPLLRPQEKP